MPSIWLLLQLRTRLTLRAWARSSARQLGVLMTLLVFVPAAHAAGNVCYHQLTSSPAGRGEPMLSAVLFIVEAIWLAVLLLAPATAGGSGMTLGRTPPLGPLRTVPVRAGHIVCAGMVGSLLDLPTLLALPLFAAVVGALAAARPAASSVMVGGELCLFAVQIAASAQAFERVRYAGRLLGGDHASVGVGVAVIGGGLLIAPPVLGAVAAGAATRGEWPMLAMASLCSVGVVALTLSAASRLTNAALLLDDGSPTARSAQRIRPRDTARVRIEKDAVERRSWPAALVDVPLVARTEWHVLTRDPARHAALRWPALSLLFACYLWIFPNLGNDALGNARDMSAMGAMLYLLFWQLQLLGNRFGTECGTAALLFGFPMDRRRMLLGRNLTLLALAGPLDAAVIAVACWQAHVGVSVSLQLIAWIPPVLLLFTALGNLTSVMAPFPLTAGGESLPREPDLSVAGHYLASIAAAAGLILGSVMLAKPLSGDFGAPTVAAVLSAAVYAATLPGAARLLVRREHRLVRILDGKG